MMIEDNLDNLFPLFLILNWNRCLPGSYLLCRETLRKLEQRNFHQDKIAAFLPKHIMEFTREKSLFISFQEKVK